MSHDDTQRARMVRAYNYVCRAQLDVELLDTKPGLQDEVEGLRQHLGAQIAKQYLVQLFGEPAESTPQEVLVELLEELRPDPTAQAESIRAALKLLNPGHAESRPWFTIAPPTSLLAGSLLPVSYVRSYRS